METLDSWRELFPYWKNYFEVKVSGLINKLFSLNEDILLLLIIDIITNFITKSMLEKLLPCQWKWKPSSARWFNKWENVVDGKSKGFYQIYVIVSPGNEIRFISFLLDDEHLNDRFTAPTISDEIISTFVTFFASSRSP